MRNIYYCYTSIIVFTKILFIWVLFEPISFAPPFITITSFFPKHLKSFSSVSANSSVFAPVWTQLQTSNFYPCSSSSEMTITYNFHFMFLVVEISARYMNRFLLCRCWIPIITVRYPSIDYRWYFNTYSMLFHSFVYILCWYPLTLLL